MDRNRIARWGAPVAFLAVITIGALVVHSGLQHGKQHAKPRTTTVTSTTKKSHGQGHRAHVKTYTVQSGDTLASIAAKAGTTVARLEQLNRGVDPTALRVGEKIRVQ